MYSQTRHRAKSKKLEEGKRISPSVADLYRISYKLNKEQTKQLKLVEGLHLLIVEKHLIIKRSASVIAGLEVLCVAGRSAKSRKSSRQKQRWYEVQTTKEEYKQHE